MLKSTQPNALDELFIRIAVHFARRAREKGSHPFGAILVHNGEIVLTAENAVAADGDLTAHAEMKLVSLACRMFSPEILAQSTIYASTEPCAMCSGAIYWVGIGRVVFGCSAVRLGEMSGGSLVISTREILGRGKRETQVDGPILEERAAQVHQDFWSGGVK